MTLVPIANRMTPGSDEHAVVASDSTMIDVDPGTSANTKNTTYTELVASSEFDADGLWVTFAVPANEDEDAVNLCDIGIGAVSSEVVLIPNLIATYGAGRRCTGEATFFPVHVPAGSRLVARGQSNSTTKNFEVGVRLVHHGYLYESFTDVESLGEDLGDSGGKEVDPGTTGNTKGAWSSMGTPTIEPKLLVLMNATASANFSLRDARFLFDVGVGATPDIIMENLAFTTDSNPDMPFPRSFGPFPYTSEGELQIRAQTQITNDSDRKMDFIAYVIG